MKLDQIYQAFLMDHYKRPRYSEILENYEFSSDLLNPSCGDQISVYCIIDENQNVKCSFQAKGCVISQSAASILMSEINDKKLNDIILFSKDQMLALIKIDLGPTRAKCALLPWDAMLVALRKSKENCVK